MKTVVTKGGIMTWINTRENKFINEHFKDNTVLEQKQLTERETYIASNLVTRGILDKNIELTLDRMLNCMYENFYI